MVLMSRVTGKAIDDLEHLKQSIIDILTTPRGSRVMLREYGCDLFYLVDRSITPQWASDVYAAIAEALGAWEPRIIVTRIGLDASNSPQGRLDMELEGIYVPNGQPIRLTGVELVFLRQPVFG